MNILCVIDSLGSGGAQRQLVNLAVAFKEKGHEVYFLVYHDDPFYNEVLNSHGISIILVREKSYIKRIFKMRKIIHSGNYDSVLSFLEAASFICEISSFPIRRWSLIVGERSANPAILTSFKLRFFRWFHFFANEVVANSNENIKMVRKVNPLLSRKKLHVIYNFIDFEKWKPNQNNYQFRKNKKFNLIVVASHQYLKNLNGLVEATHLLSGAEKKQLAIHWYGGERLDNSKNEALVKIKEYELTGIFHFYDPTIEIAAKVNEADALGLFSFYEGLPNVVCEAMVNSKPIISSAISDVPLFLNEEFTFDPKDFEDIAAKIRLLLQLDEKSLKEIGDSNRKVALTNFSKEDIVKNYLSLMKNK
ncbi:glycosyltransferase [Acinetobacter haemolyticus]|uniref:glycosyltransferase n=1 Tax=Acinetobacter haemolyticus TaxID=29430 RepID=UPI0013726140|nr:glycosyltransferase [Acinetobacter haemolyticus]NAR17273.1 glycosyltransferase [Acinetobacter haemolyticus]